jgi:hypothetical protein
VFADRRWPAQQIRLGFDPAPERITRIDALKDS